MKPGRAEVLPDTTWGGSVEPVLQPDGQTAELTRLFITQRTADLPLIHAARQLSRSVDQWVCDPQARLAPSTIALVVRRSERLCTAVRLASRREMLPIVEGALHRLKVALPQEAPTRVRSAVDAMEKHIRVAIVSAARMPGLSTFDDDPAVVAAPPKSSRWARFLLLVAAFLLLCAVGWAVSVRFIPLG